MNNWLKNNHLLNIGALVTNLFQQPCLLCASKVQGELGLCADCLQSLPTAPKPSCPQCGLNTKGEVCGTCLNTKPSYDATYALFAYAFPVDALLQHYKYNNALYLSQTLGRLLQEKMVATTCDLIIPMPLHPSRVKERGFNQSLEVAKVMAKKHDIALDSISCRRIKNTPPQASLAPKERVSNMKNAFDCTTDFSGQHIALVDDVMTTGASLNALAKTLKQAGAAKVSCYVMARTT
jgi:ComF family protein